MDVISFVVVLRIDGCRELDAGHLRVTEMWGALSAVAYDDELWAPSGGAVPRAVLAHHLARMGKFAQVLHTLDAALDPHADIEAVEAFDEADGANSPSGGG
ncbi:hypothetical protein DL764_003184 [Monosporascus ibericus]|uniref:Uncharacterized protein n=1 Tax=Monosporascus ibericus TaxID=155417 RepID=A0A4Q4TIR1_9PEZI|nr:hypothetical protein DL764_003184 [Monosporascus ibericus]